VYQKICKKYNKVPIRNVLRQFGKTIVSLKRANLSQREIKAFFVALVVGLKIHFWINKYMYIY